MKNKKCGAIGLAVLAAVFYAIDIPCSKVLLTQVPAAMMAGFLYLGAGLGVGGLFLLRSRSGGRAETLTRADLPYAAGMVGLDILALTLLMYGLRSTASADASLLNNFEIVATTVIAWAVFQEEVSGVLWLAVLLVTFASMLLSAESLSGPRFSWGSLSVLAAAVCWGLENNFTRKLSAKNPYEIVTVKGLGSGLGALAVGGILGERLPAARVVPLVMLLGFVSYGISIVCYIKAQKELGAAQTSAYYAIAPFVGAFLSFAVLREPFTARYFIALLLMMAGSAAAAMDTLRLRHRHAHTHRVSHAPGDDPQAREIIHTHEHSHFFGRENHRHLHLAAR